MQPKIWTPPEKIERVTFHKYIGPLREWHDVKISWRHGNVSRENSNHLLLPNLMRPLTYIGESLCVSVRV